MKNKIRVTNRFKEKGLTFDQKRTMILDAFFDRKEQPLSLKRDPVVAGLLWDEQAKHILESFITERYLHKSKDESLTPTDLAITTQKYGGFGLPFHKRIYKDLATNRTFWIPLIASLFAASYTLYSDLKKDSNSTELERKLSALDSISKAQQFLFASYVDSFAVHEAKLNTVYQKYIEGQTASSEPRQETDTTKK